MKIGNYKPTIKVYQGYLEMRETEITNYEKDSFLSLSTSDYTLTQDLEWITGRQVTLRYWVTNRKCSIKEAITQHTKLCLGYATAKFEVNYSELTGYLYTDECLNIGGHDLLQELENNVGKYIIIEVTAK